MKDFVFEPIFVQLEKRGVSQMNFRKSWNRKKKTCGWIYPIDHLTWNMDINKFLKNKKSSSVTMKLKACVKTKDYSVGLVSNMLITWNYLSPIFFFLLKASWKIISWSKYISFNYYGFKKSPSGSCWPKLEYQKFGKNDLKAVNIK